MARLSIPYYPLARPVTAKWEFRRRREAGQAWGQGRGRGEPNEKYRDSRSGYYSEQQGHFTWPYKLAHRRPFIDGKSRPCAPPPPAA